MLADINENAVPNICCLVGYQVGLMHMALLDPVMESSRVLSLLIAIKSCHCPCVGIAHSVLFVLEMVIKFCKSRIPESILKLVGKPNMLMNQLPFFGCVWVFFLITCTH